MVAASIGPATMNTITIPGKSSSNDPRVHPQPNTSVAPDTAVRTSHCTRCAGDGTQSASTPNAANSVAATMANVPAESDAVAVGAHRPDERVARSPRATPRSASRRSRSRGGPPEGSGPCTPRGRRRARGSGRAGTRRRAIAASGSSRRRSTDEQGGRRQRDQGHQDGEVPGRAPRFVQAAPSEDRGAGDDVQQDDRGLAHQRLRSARRHQGTHDDGRRRGHEWHERQPNEHVVVRRRRSCGVHLAGSAPHPPSPGRRTCMTGWTNPHRSRGCGFRYGRTATRSGGAGAPRRRPPCGPTRPASRRCARGGSSPCRARCRDARRCRGSCGRTRAVAGPRSREP